MYCKQTVSLHGKFLIFKADMVKQKKMIEKDVKYVNDNFFYRPPSSVN